MKREKIKGFAAKYPVLTNVLIILVIGVIGVWIVYVSAAIFTKHGESETVPGVENMSYTHAVELLHSVGFNVEIRDSLFRDDIKPGYVIEQFPKANSIVKPGRKIFLYINAVHPKEVVLDDSNSESKLALKGWSYRQAIARLHELGFKNIRTVTVLGNDDRVVKITANGKTVAQMQKIPVNARILVEVSDGRLSSIRDSFYNIERLLEFQGDGSGIYEDEESGYGENYEGNSSEESEEPYYEETDFYDL